jgi:hypothetical protein
MRKRKSQAEAHAAWQRAVTDLRERETELARSINAVPGGVSLESTQLKREVAQMRLLVESLALPALAETPLVAVRAAKG